MAGLQPFLRHDQHTQPYGLGWYMAAPLVLYSKIPQQSKSVPEHSWRCRWHQQNTGISPLRSAIKPLHSGRDDHEYGIGKIL
jgi:hypothetical protein